MQTLNKLAGVQEASSTHNDSDTRSARRVSIPRSQTSRKSLREFANLPSEQAPPTPRLPPDLRHQTSSISQQQQHPPLPSRPSGESAVSSSSEFSWGPSHPCFPHPNPHGDASAHNTRVIRIKRDWLSTGDLCPQYLNLYPEILDPYISDAAFRQLITQLNALLVAAFSPFTARAWADSLLGAFTGYIWDDSGFAGAKKGEKQVERFIDRWNEERASEGKEIRLVQLRRTGFMALDFVIPDPEIDFAAAAVDEQQQAEEDDGAVSVSGRRDVGEARQ